MRKGKCIKIMSALLVFTLAFSLNININTGINGTSPSPNKHFLQLGMKEAEAAYNGEPTYIKNVDGVSYVIQEFKSSGTFIVPTNITTVDVTVVGGGGGGGGSNQKRGTGSGGMPGVLENVYNSSVTPNTSLTITVGNGGGSDDNGWYGDNGKSSRVYNFTLGINIIANGGSGGNGDTRNNPNPGIGGDPSTGSTTIIGVNGKTYGGKGASGTSQSNYNPSGQAPGGGYGGSRGSSAGNGVDGIGGGGGGAGYSSRLNGEPGGFGGSGIVVIRWLANTNPILTLAQPTSNSPYSAVTGHNTMTISGTVTDTDVGDTLTVKYRIDTGTNQTLQSLTATGAAQNYSGTTSVGSLAQGSHTLYTWVEDDKGGKSPEISRPFIIDKTAPTVTFGTNGNATPAKKHSTTVTVTDTYSVATRQYQWTQSSTFPTAGTWINFASGGIITQPNGNGDYYLHIKAIDQIGNTRKITSNKFVLDNTAPTVTFGTNGNATPAKKHSTTVTVTDTYSVATRQYQWTQSATFPTAGTWTSFTSGATLAQSSGTGSYYLHIKATDGAGNIRQSSSGAFVVDNTPPTTPTLTQNPLAGTWTNSNVSVTITYSADSNTRQYKIGSGGTWTTYTVPVVISTNNTVYARAIDIAGNISAEGNIVVSNIDKTAPTASIVSVNVIDMSSISVTASASDAGSGLHPTETYRYNRNNEDIGTWANNSMLNDTGLTPNTQYTYKVKAKDAVGNIGAYSSIVSKYTKALNPTKVQVLENGTNFIKVKITNSPSNGVIPDTKLIIKAKGTSTVIAIADWSKDDAKTISGITEGQKYDLYLNVRNENGIENGEIKLSSTSNPPLYSSDGITLIDEIVTVISVENFRITETSVSTIKTEWNNVQGQEYQVYLKDAGNNEVGRSSWISSTDLTLDYTFSSIGLIPNTRYIPHIITRIKDNAYSTEPIYVSNTDKVFTDAEGIGRARFTPGEDFIIVELAVDSLDNPNDTSYIIRNDITGQTANVTHDDPIWTNKGLAKESEYEYSVKVNHKNLKESYFTRLIFENGLNNGKSAHTIIASIEIPDDLIVTLGEVINPGELATLYDPNNMEGKIINIDGINYVLTKSKKATIQNSPSKPVVNATKYATSTNNIGFNAWYDMKSDGTFAQPIMFNTPGFYINQIKFKNSLGRETENWAEINYIADWIMPEVAAEKKIPYQSATSDTFTITVNATDNASPHLYYSIDNGSTWNTLPEGIQDITFTNISKSAAGDLNNLVIKVGDLCGNVMEKSFAIWGISK